MKYLFTVVFFFVLKFNFLAQIPFSITSASGTYTITCKDPQIILHACTSFSSAVNYSWVSSSTTKTGSLVVVNLPGIYSVTANSGSVSSTQTISISQNTAIPVATLSPLSQTIVCNSTTASVSAGVSSPNSAYTHFFTSPFGTNKEVAGSTASFFPGTSGIFSHLVIDNANGCASALSTFTLLGTGFPTFSVTSAIPVLGCLTASINLIQIINAVSQPTGGPISFTLVSPGSALPPASGLLSPNSAYTVNVAGNHTLIVRDNLSMCDSKTELTLNQDIPPQFFVVCCNNTVTCKQPSVTVSVLSTQNYTYSGAIGSNTILATQNTGTLNVTGIDIYRCATTKSFVVINDKAAPSVSSSINSDICSGNAATLTPIIFSFSKPFSYSWTSTSNPTVGVETGSTIVTSVPGNYSVTITNTINGCKSVANIAVLSCNGLNESETLRSVRVFPNPACDIITVNFHRLDQQCQIKIVDTQGKVVKETNCNTKELTINISDLSIGLYQILIKSEGQVLQRRLVKN